MSHFINMSHGTSLCRAQIPNTYAPGKPSQRVNWRQSWRTPVCQCEGDLIGLNVIVGSSCKSLKLGLESNMCPSPWPQYYNTGPWFGVMERLLEKRHTDTANSIENPHAEPHHSPTVRTPDSDPPVCSGSTVPRKPVWKSLGYMIRLFAFTHTAPLGNVMVAVPAWKKLWSDIWWVMLQGETPFYKPCRPRHFLFFVFFCCDSLKSAFVLSLAVLKCSQRHILCSAGVLWPQTQNNQQNKQRRALDLFSSSDKTRLWES